MPLNNTNAYYVINPSSAATELAVHIVLDTPNTAGGAGGHIDGAQFAWLEQQLKRYSSRYLTTSGTVFTDTSPGAWDRLIVIHSHHTLDSMKRTFIMPDSSKTGDDLKALLLRFPNVVLYVNGHNHKNR